METRVIYKYTLVGDVRMYTKPGIPDNAEIVKFGVDNRGLWCIWAIILNDDTRVSMDRQFIVTATGVQVVDTESAGHEFIATFIDDQKFVWTLWEIV